jgi:ribosome-associated translation inhibitor RaiA
MRISVRAQGFDLPAGLREHTERHLRLALGWAGEHLRRISVRLDGGNSPRGRKDKRCRIAIVIAGTKGLVVEDTETDLYVAIGRAADRASRMVALRLDRQRAASPDLSASTTPAGPVTLPQR